jgi:hypothetical protein
METPFVAAPVTVTVTTCRVCGGEKGSIPTRNGALVHKWCAGGLEEEEDEMITLLDIEESIRFDALGIGPYDGWAVGCPRLRSVEVMLADDREAERLRWR